MTTSPDKKELLRKKVSSERASMNDEEWKAASDLVFHHVTSSEYYKKANVVNCYVSMNQRREVDTHSLIRVMLEAGKRVVVPVTNFKDKSLTPIELKHIEDLQQNKWGVPEPQNGEKVSVQEFDLVIVPMMAADKRGVRLGYGQGFYDRFLPDISAPKIGLVFERFILQEIPSEHFDEKVDVLISEKGIYLCNNPQRHS